MNETKTDWDEFRIFVAVARARGLAGAAAATGKSAPTLSRHVLALERRLALSLFERSQSGYALTSDGEQLFNKLLEVERMLEPLNKRESESLAAPVKVSAGAWVTHYLCTRIGSWIDSRRISVEFLASDHVLDISHREAVIGIRNRKPEQANLVCQPLKQVNFAAYAVNESVETWVQVVGNTPSSRWVSQTCKDKFCIKVSHPRNAMDVMKSGAGRAVLPTFVGDEEEGLKRVSEHISELEHRQWLVMHQEDRRRPEVRETINFLKKILGNGRLIG